MPKLIVHKRGSVSVSVIVDHGARLGRVDSCDVVLDDAKVSRHHATLNRLEEGWVLIDESSRHGTFLNGARVQHSAALHSGDKIQVGGTLLVFSESESIAEAVSTLPSGHSLPQSDGHSLQLRVLYKLAEAARSIADSEEFLCAALAALVEGVSAQRAIVALAPAPGQALSRVASHNGDEIVVDRHLIARVMERGESVLSHQHGEGRASSGVSGPGKVHIAMIAPLHSVDKPRGFIYVDNHLGGAVFGQSELELVHAVATFSSSLVLVSSRLERAAVVEELVLRRGKQATIGGGSDAIADVRRDLEKLIAVELPIHITGESGVGKELVAREIHSRSARSKHPFVVINCAALPDTLIESELFGHAKGAFTGAGRPRKGKLLLANMGTIFLDEVAELSLAAQSKLLRVLEDGEVFPLGADEAVHVDFRIVSASHKNLLEMVALGTFREDLYYRLAVASIRVPPLRDRGEDLLALAQDFLEQAARRGTKGQVLSPESLSALLTHSWPGNVRELRNVIERASALATDATIGVADLRLFPPRSSIAKAVPENLADRFAELGSAERELVELALNKEKGNVSAAARALGISRIMLKRRIDRFGLVDG